MTVCTRCKRDKEQKLFIGKNKRVCKTCSDCRGKGSNRKKNAQSMIAQTAHKRMVFDKKVNGGCSSKRPDVRIERLTHSIIVEIDEHQHKNYSCENKRTMTLFKDLGSRPIVFIRFNPDKYGDNKSCFSKTPKTGQLKPNKKELDKRLPVLKKTIHQYLEPQNKNVHIVKLFYD